MLFLFSLATALPYLVSIGLYFAARGAASPPLRLARAIGWCALCIVPAILVQDVILVGGWSHSSFDPSDCLVALPLQLWVLLGGGVVQHVFEATAKAISGHRQATMLDNWPIYYSYTIAWVLPWSVLVMLRLRARAWSRDPLAWSVAALLGINALWGVLWPWWGS